MPSTSVICLYLNKAYQRLTQMNYALGQRQTMYKSKLESKVGTLLPKSQASRKTHKFQLPCKGYASSHGTREWYK
jgi:hypothetical protein